MQVWYMNGAGNTFLVLDARGCTYDLPNLAKKLCAQYGADGFMAVDTAKKADFRLHFYNRDGSRAQLCGNGARCICRFAYEAGIAGSCMQVQTDAGLVPGWRLSEDSYRVGLPPARQLRREGGCTCVTVGVPHAVVPWAQGSWDPDDLRPLAQQLRQRLDANVDFFRLTGAARAEVLTYERGVEDFTLACGTGCAAVAAALGLPGLEALNRGGRLLVENSPNGLFLTGPTQITGIWDL